MIIYGAGGHAKVIIEILEDRKEPIRVIFDDDLSRTKILNNLVLGKYDKTHFENDKLIIAIGSNELREAISFKISHEFANVISRNSFVSKYATIGKGNAIFTNALVHADVEIGNHCIINSGAQLDHDCKIEDFVHIGPSAILCGNVFVGKKTLIGAGSIILPGIEIGENVVVGAGSVIRKNLENNSTFVGNPAKRIK